MFLAGGMTGVAVQYSCDMLSVGKREIINFYLHIFKPLMALDALGVGHLRRSGNRDSSFGVACGTRRLLPLMTFEAGLFRRAKGGGIMGVMVDVVMAGGTGIFQLFDMEPVRNRDLIWIEIGGGLFDIKNTWMAADTVWVDLIELGRKTGMLPLASKRKDVDTRHQGMTRRMTFRAINFRMHRRLLPKRRFPLLMMAGDTKFLLGGGIGGERNRYVKAQDDENPS